MNPKLTSGDRNLRQRQGHRTGTTFQQQRQPSWCKAESLRPACQIPQRQRPQSKFPRGKRMGTAVRQRHQPSAESSLRECRSGTTPERRQNEARTTSPATPSPNICTHARAQAGRQAGRTKTQIPTVYGQIQLRQRTTCRHAGVTLHSRGLETIYHDNPRQSHARTQRATSFRHPPRVRATTKA